MIGESSNRPTAYDKFSDSLDQKLLDFNLKVIVLLISLIWKPLAICTDPFFRKNFGERYLTGTSVLVATIIWSLAEQTSKLTSYLQNPIERIFYDSQWYRTAEWLHAHDVSGKFAYCVSFAYGFLAIMHFFWIHRRRATPQRWHSMSRGESIFGNENRLRDGIIALAAIGILNIFAPPIGLLFFCSRIASFYLTRKQEQSLYTRYLNGIDKKIEMESLQRALDKGEAPRLTDGLYSPLPKQFKGEHRTNMAKVIAPEDDGKEPLSRPRPAEQQTESFPTMCKILIVEGLRMRIAFLWRFKRVIATFILVVVLATLCVKAVSFIRSALHKSPAKPKTIAEAILRTLPPPAETSTRTPLSVTSTNEPAAADLTPPARDDSTARQQAALEKQRRLDLEQAERARKKAIEQIQNMLDAQVAELTKFKASCEKRLDDNTNKIANVIFYHRSEFRDKNQQARTNIETILGNEQGQLDAFHSTIQSPSSSQLDPQQTSAQLVATVVSQQQERQQVVAALDSLDALIAGVPKRIRIFK